MGLKRGPWKRKPSGLWLAIERECPEMGKGILDEREREKERDAEEFARVFGSIERVYFVKYACACVVPDCESWKRGEPMENAHGRTGGMGRKADHLCINPLCHGHHRTRQDSLHALGSVERFDAEVLEPHGLSWALCAADTEDSWQRLGGRFIEDARRDGRFQKWAGA